MVCACIFVDGLITRRIIRWGMHVTVYHDRTITTDSIVLYDVSSISTFNIIHIIFLFFLHWVFGVYIVPSTTKFSPFFRVTSYHRHFKLFGIIFLNLIFNVYTFRFFAVCVIQNSDKPYFHIFLIYQDTLAFKLMIYMRR